MKSDFSEPNQAFEFSVDAAQPPLSPQFGSRAPRKYQEKKLSPAELDIKKNEKLAANREKLFSFLRGSEVCGMQNPTPYHVQRNEHGMPLILKEFSPKTVVVVDPNTLIATIASFCKKMTSLGEFPYTKKRDWLDFIADFEFDENTLSEEIEFLSDNPAAWAFNRPSINIEEGPTPLWDELMSRTENSQSLQSFIWSLADRGSSSHQYLWIYGPGGVGKSCITRALGRIFKNSLCVFNSRPTGQFWESDLIGKRLCIMNDCDFPEIVCSGRFKSITGGDSARIERKYSSSYRADLYTKFIFASNEVPNFEDNSADKRRVILCQISENKTDFGDDYEDRLALEFGRILWRCRDIYLGSPGSSKKISADDSGFEEIISSNDEFYHSMILKFFRITPPQILRSDSLATSEQRNYILRRDFHTALAAACKLSAGFQFKYKKIRVEKIFKKLGIGIVRAVLPKNKFGKFEREFRFYNLAANFEAGINKTEILTDEFKRETQNKTPPNNNVKII